MRHGAHLVPYPPNVEKSPFTPVCHKGSEVDKADRMYFRLSMYRETRETDLLPEIVEWELTSATAYDKLDIFPYYLKTDKATKAPKAEVNV